jgi:hypothetical protein
MVRNVGGEEVSVGSVLVGVGIALVVAAYLVRPFRVKCSEADLDRVIEIWVGQVRAMGDQARHCPQCGRRASRGDRFCAGCGARLDGAAE